MADAQSFTRLENRWKPDHYVHIENGPVAAGPIQPGWWSAQWTLEEVPDTPYRRIRNRWKPDHYVHVENGPVAVGPIQPGWWSAQWTLEPVSGTSYYRLRNRWKPDLALHIENGRLEAGTVQPGWWSAMWSLEGSSVAGQSGLSPSSEAETSGGASVATTSGGGGSGPAAGGGQLAYMRGVGTVPDRCGPDEEYEAGLCYDECRSGYAGGATVCAQTCPGGFRDDGLFCAKPSSYGRGAGYPWEFGDTAFSLDDARSRCRRENSQGCEKHGEIIYPKCRSGFKPVGCCVCSPVCPGGMTDIGVSCAKKTYDRGVGRVPTSCGPGEVNEAGLCYEPCRAGYVGVGPSCFAELDPASLERLAREAERKWNETRRQMQPVVDVVEAHLRRVMQSPPGPERVAEALRSGGHQAVARMFDVDGLRAALRRVYAATRVGRVEKSGSGSERGRWGPAEGLLEVPVLPSARSLLAGLVPDTWRASAAGVLPSAGGAPLHLARAPARAEAVQVASAPLERSILLLLPNIDIGFVASAAADWGFAFPIHDSTGGSKCIRSQSWALGLTAGLDSAPLGFGVCDAAPKDLAGTGHGFGGGASAAAGIVIQAYYDYGEGLDALGRGEGHFGDFQCFTLQAQVGASAEIEYVRGQTQVDEPITCVP